LRPHTFQARPIREWTAASVNSAQTASL